tara:strand:+ start:998 stop:1579 length:582 start_codon:yes stop_codon:yes gene_type:complete
MSNFNERKLLLNGQLKLYSLSLPDLGLSGIWAIYFVKRGYKNTSEPMAMTCNTISIVSVLSCGISTAILITKPFYLPSMILGTIGLLGTLFTVLICVLHENMIRQLFVPELFIQFIVQHYFYLRLPVIIFSLSIHCIAGQIILYTWNTNIILGIISSSLSIIGCIGINSLREKYRNILRNEIKVFNEELDTIE